MQRRSRQGSTILGWVLVLFAILGLVVEEPAQRLLGVTLSETLLQVIAMVLLGSLILGILLLARGRHR
jgi:hypothetical protein